MYPERMTTSAFLLLAVPCAVATAATAGDDRAERAVAAIEKVGGTVQRDESRPGSPVYAVDFYNSRLTDSVMSHLRALPEIREFHVSNAPITDAGIAT